jgi:2-polyprenyl-6-methoxyphenol hydroxylase-like FAD-dependent oxidoreductase
MEELMPFSNYDVVISGAGPVGLFLACELALVRCSVLVLEKAESAASPFKQLPFGVRGLSAPTVEALDRRGLLTEFELHKRLKNPHKTTDPEGPRRQRGHFAGIPFVEGNVDVARWPYRLPSSTDTMLLSEMAEVEAVLVRHAEALGVEIRRGHAVTDFHQTADRVRVQAGSETVEAKWLVGCDGARSVVRKQADFEFAGTEPEFTGYSVQCELANPELLKPGRNLTATGMYFQSQPGYLVMVEFDGGAAHRTEPATLDHVQQVLRRISNTSVGIANLHAVTTWTDRARQATAYRKGRVLLAGDAAHIHAPLGGQGLNLGVGDAMNLGWKLAATIHSRAPEGLLDSYEIERQPLGQQVLDWSRAQVAIMKPDPASRALNAIMRDLIDTRDGATYIAARVWGIFHRYELGGGHPLIGQSVPNFEFEDGRTVNELMRDGRGLLLDFSSASSLQALANKYCAQVRYLAGQANDTLGLSVALVRPDGMIAWAAQDLCDRNELEQAFARWFVGA